MVAREQYNYIVIVAGQQPPVLVSSPRNRGILKPPDSHSCPVGILCGGSEVIPAYSVVSITSASKECCTTYLRISNKARISVDVTIPVHLVLIPFRQTE